MSIEGKLAELGLCLPVAPARGGVYASVLIIDRLAYVSGHGPRLADGSLITGVVGETLTIAEGQSAAKATALAMLATLKDQLGSLDRIERIVKTLGMVRATADFADHPAVINGFSQIFVDLWGDDRGRGARSAIGMGSLPGGMAVEVEAVFQLRDDR